VTSTITAFVTAFVRAFVRAFVSEKSAPIDLAAPNTRG
jgi:hypothetical protein